jgi:hypothetical protein
MSEPALLSILCCVLPTAQIRLSETVSSFWPSDVQPNRSADAAASHAAMNDAAAESAPVEVKTEMTPEMEAERGQPDACPHSRLANSRGWCRVVVSC